MFTPFNFKWFIQKPDQLIEETLFKFGFRLHDPFEKIYFSNGKDYIGILNNFNFFVNDKIYNFKLTKYMNPELIPFQNKTNTFNFLTSEDILISYNIGFKNDNEAYWFEIKENGIIMNALKDGKERSFPLE